MLTAPIEWQLIAKVVIWFFQQYADIFYKGKWFLKKTQNDVGRHFWSKTKERKRRRLQMEGSGQAALDQIQPRCN